MRLPLVTEIVSRDGTTGRDATLKNGVVEINGEEAIIRKRPGMYDLGSVGAGAAQLLAPWQGKLIGVAGDLVTQNIISGGSGEDWTKSRPVPVGYMPLLLDTNGDTVVMTVMPSGPGALYVFRSTDGGVTWDAGAALGNDTIYIAYTNGVWGAARGVYMAPSIFYYSTDDGVTWNTASMGTGSDSMGVLQKANNLFFAFGAAGKVRTSPDGIAWTSRNISTTNNPFTVAFDGTTYVVGANNGVVFTSTDLSSWASHTVKSGSYDIDVCGFFGGVFVAIVDEGSDWSEIWTSPDGASWAQIYSTANDFDIDIGPFIAGTANRKITQHNGAYWICVAGYIGVSYDLVNWTYTIPAIEGGFWSDCAVATSDAMVFMVRNTYVDNLFRYKEDSETITVEDSYTLTPISATPELFYNLSGAANSDQYLFVKSDKEGFLLDREMSLNKITDTDYPGWNTHSVSSITRSGATATVTTASATNIKTGTSVTIAGAAQTEYNGTFVVTVTGSTTFTYQVAGSPATPATGTITATGGITTVPGCVFLDATFYVMDENATIYGSDLNNPSAWNALNFITAIKEPGGGVAIAKSQNYVIAFKEWSTELFFDAGNATGSPLSPVDNGFALVGCASGKTVADVDGTLFWVSQTKQAGRGVHMMIGLESKDITTPSVRRILNRDNLSQVAAYGLRIGGAVCYVLTLIRSNITLVYNAQSGMWSEWSSLTAQSAQSCTITSADGIATVTCAAHGFSSGDAVLIAGATQSSYNGRKHIIVIDADTFSFPVYGSPASPATGTITATGYNRSYFKLTKHVKALGRDLLLHESSGHVFYPKDTQFSDDAPIDFVIRTGKFDGGSTVRKTCSAVELIGNKTTGEVLMRWSDDDNQSFGSFRRISLDAERSRITRCGSFRRRSFELSHVTDDQIQISALDVTLGE